MSLTTEASITWETAFANQLDLNGLADNSVSYSKPIGETMKVTSGEEDAWTFSTEYFANFDARGIPPSTLSGAFTATGWNGVTGFRAFLEWARDGNEFRFIPDRTDLGTFILSRLVAPGPDEVPSLEGNGFRRVSMIIRNNLTAYEFV